MVVVYSEHYLGFHIRKAAMTCAIVQIVWFSICIAINIVSATTYYEDTYWYTDTIAFVIDGLMIFTALLVMLGLAKRRPALVLPALILMFIPAFGLGMLLGWAIYLAFYGFFAWAAWVVAIVGIIFLGIFYRAYRDAYHWLKHDCC